MVTLAMFWLLAPFVLIAAFLGLTTLLGITVVIVCYIRHKRANKRDGVE